MLCSLLSRTQKAIIKCEFAKVVRPLWAFGEAAEYSLEQVSPRSRLRISDLDSTELEEHSKVYFRIERSHFFVPT